MTTPTVKDDTRVLIPLSEVAKALGRPPHSVRRQVAAGGSIGVPVVTTYGPKRLRARYWVRAAEWRELVTGTQQPARRADQ